MKNITIQLTALIALLFAQQGATAQNPGDLDLDFGIGGYVFTDLIANTSEVYVDMITLSDDKILLVGYTDSGDQDIFLARFLPDGTPDEDFGINGYTEIDLSLGMNDEGWAVKELSDGKLLVTGITVANGSWDGFIMRLNSDGMIDDSFGTSSPGHTKFNAGDETIALGTAIEVLSDNSILVGGSALFSEQSDMCVWKFSQGGAAVPAFASDGVAVVDIDGDNDEVFAMTLTPNEQILLAGISDSGDIQRGVVVKLTSFGTPTSFGDGSGSATFSFGSDFNELNEIALDNQGRIVAVGSQGEAPDTNGLIIRLDADGVLDNSFNGNGIQQSDPGMTTAMHLMNVFIMADNGILATGFTANPSADHSYAFLMKENGTPDSDFGDNGDVSIPFSIETNYVNGRCAALQSDGSILIGGDITSQDFIGNNLFMIRLKGPDNGNSIEQFASINTLSLYPNPASDSFRLTLDGRVQKVELYAASGQLIDEWNMTNSNETFHLAPSVDPGIYVVRAISAKGIFTGSLMVQ